MKKLVSIIAIFSIVPGISMGYSAKYNRLVSEKQRKIEELEKCSGNVNGWKIAGISTLGLTAVGVAGNVALANEGKEYDKKLEKADKSLNGWNKKIDENKSADSTSSATPSTTTKSTPTTQQDAETKNTTSGSGANYLTVPTVSNIKTTSSDVTNAVMNGTTIGMEANMRQLRDATISVPSGPAGLSGNSSGGLGDFSM